MSAPIEREPLVGVHEVSRYLGIAIDTLHQWHSTGIGPKCSKVGRHLRYRWADIDAWLEEKAVRHE